MQNRALRNVPFQNSLVARNGVWILRRLARFRFEGSVRLTPHEKSRNNEKNRRTLHHGIGSFLSAASQPLGRGYLPRPFQCVCPASGDPGFAIVNHGQRDQGTIAAGAIATSVGGRVRGSHRSRDGARSTRAHDPVARFAHHSVLADRNRADDDYTRQVDDTT